MDKNIKTIAADDHSTPGWRQNQSKNRPLARFQSAFTRPEVITGFQRVISRAMSWPKASGVPAGATTPYH